MRSTTSFDIPGRKPCGGMRELESGNADVVVSPDLTFTALPAHLIVQAIDLRRFDVEVCLPRARKLLGVFSFGKFYTYQGVSPDRVSEMLRQFCGDDLEQKHRYFAQQREQQSARAD